MSVSIVGVEQTRNRGPSEQVPREAARAPSEAIPGNVWGGLCLFTHSNSASTRELLKLHSRVPSETSLARQNGPRTRFCNIPLCFFRTSLEVESQGKAKHLVLEYYFNTVHTAHLKEEKSFYAPWKRGAAAELLSVAAVLQPSPAVRPGSCPCGV